jgi:galactonate dehydratase
MKITKITPMLINRYLYVEVETDEGIKGLGESGAWGFLEASCAAVEQLHRAIIGKDPLNIEFLWNYMYRCYHFRGAAIMGALSAIDIALWDISGKYYNAPVYQLLGGKCRDKARVYYHVFGSTTEELVQGCKDAKAKGFNAVGHLTPFVNTFDRTKPAPFQSYAQRMHHAIDAVRQYREAVGDEVDICIEVHRQCSIHEAITLAHGIEKYFPYFYEDPVRPDNFDDMVEVSKKIHIPIATGERFHTPQEFAMLLSKGAVQYVRPDVCLCGGITGAKKIAAMAEAFGAEVVPHNPLSPVSTMACLQIAASAPNFAIQEYPLGQEVPPQSEIVGPVPKATPDGFLLFNKTPGIGIKLLEGAAEKYPHTPRHRDTLLKSDGSIFDQ